MIQVTDKQRITTRHEAALSLLVLYAASLAVMGPKLRLSQWQLSPQQNVAAGEAMAWLDGRLHLDGRGGDTALHNGRAYNVFPPLGTIVCYAVFGVQRLLYGEVIGLNTVQYVLLLAVPIPGAFWLAFRGAGLGVWWSAFFAFYAIAGTCLWPVAAACHDGWIYSNQHVACQIGLAILAFDLLGRRRLWLAGIGLIIAMWSRYLCAFFAIPILWTAWRERPRSPALLRAGIPIAIAWAVPMALNQAKFGSPLESGYRYIYEGMTGTEANRVRQPDGDYEFFALKYMAPHAWHMWLSPPTVYWEHDGLHIEGAGGGTGLFYGSPLLLLLFVDLKRWWSDPARRAMVLATVPVVLALLAYYGPGYGTPGYYRYTLDFQLLWLAALAPGACTADRRKVVILCLSWSVLYFYLVTV